MQIINAPSFGALPLVLSTLKWVKVRQHLSCARISNGVVLVSARLVFYKKRICKERFALIRINRDTIQSRLVMMIRHMTNMFGKNLSTWSNWLFLGQMSKS
jgi:hypothetical protein